MYALKLIGFFLGIIIFLLGALVIEIYATTHGGTSLIARIAQHALGIATMAIVLAILGFWLTGKPVPGLTWLSRVPEVTLGTLPSEGQRVNVLRALWAPFFFPRPFMLAYNSANPYLVLHADYFEENVLFMIRRTHRYTDIAAVDAEDSLGPRLNLTLHSGTRFIFYTQHASNLRELVTFFVGHKVTLGPRAQELLRK